MPAAPLNPTSRVPQGPTILARTEPAMTALRSGGGQFSTALAHASGDSANPMVGGGGKADSDEAKIAESCRQFEGIMVKQILTASKLPLVGSAGGGAVGAIYNDLVTEKLADQMTAGGGMGLASALQAQLSRQAHPKARHSTDAHSD